MAWILLGVLVLVPVLAPRFGQDSRQSRDWETSNVNIPRERV